MAHVNQMLNMQIAQMCKQNGIRMPADATRAQRLKQLKAHIAEQHKTDGVRGRLPNVKIEVLKSLLQKHDKPVYGTYEDLLKRVKKLAPKKMPKKTDAPMSPVKTIAKTTKRLSELHFDEDFSASLAPRLGVKVGDKCTFKNGVSKILVTKKGDDQKFRWKTC